METLTEPLPVLPHSLDPKIMDDLLPHHSWERIAASNFPTPNIPAVTPAKPLPSSHLAETQAKTTHLIPAPLHMISDIDTTMVISAALAPFPRDPCQDHSPDISNPCIDLLGGDPLSSIPCQLIRSPRSSIHWILPIKILWTLCFTAPLWKMLIPVNCPC